MTTKELLYIKAIIEEESVSGAAKKLFVAQPALSQLIKRIEDNYEIRLFNRVGNKISPTADGEKYYSMANQILNITENFLLEISNDNKLNKGKVRLGTTNFLGASILPKILPRFYDSYPKVELKIVETNTTELEEGLLNGELDLVVMHSLTENINNKINYNLISRDEFLILTNKQNPINRHSVEVKGRKFPQLDLNLLESENFIMVHKDQRIRQVTDTILRKAEIFNPKILYTLKNFSTVQLIISNGVGVTFMPQRYLSILSNTDILACFSIEEKYNAYWDLCIATNKNLGLSLAATIFMDMLKIVLIEDRVF